eukprot:COSAG06_NODE_17784_length_921_cov_1.879562_1_plen_198_part_10
MWRRGYHSTVQAAEGRAARVELAPAARLRDAPSVTVAIEDTWRLPSGGRGGGSSGPAGALTLFAGGSFEAALWLLDGAAAEDSAEAARRPLVLDFASDSNPGGGWRGKQQGTQEESLCRQSNLGLAAEKVAAEKVAAEKVAAAFRDALLSQQHCGRFDHVSLRYRSVGASTSQLSKRPYPRRRTRGIGGGGGGRGGWR